jgi:hypothetical protein
MRASAHDLPTPHMKIPASTLDKPRRSDRACFVKLRIKAARLPKGCLSSPFGDNFFLYLETFASLLSRMDTAKLPPALPLYPWRDFVRTL